MLKKFFSIGVMALLFVACDDSSSTNSSEKEDTKDTELPKDSVSAKDLTVAKDTQRLGILLRLRACRRKRNPFCR